MAKDIEAAYGIMDAETQKALDKAADQIERFKNKATIRVGELISMEGDGAAFKILWEQFASVSGQFGLSLMSQVLKLAGSLPATIGVALQAAVKGQDVKLAISDFWDFDNNILKGVSDKMKKSSDMRIEALKNQIKLERLLNGEKEKLEKEALAAAAAQAEMSSQTNTLVESLEAQEKALKAIRDQVGEYYDKQKEAIDLERKQFIQAKELDVLKLRASGEKAKADALQIQIDKMEKAIEISDKYGISLKKAANLVENIDRAEKSAANKATNEATNKGVAVGQNARSSNGIKTGRIETGKIGEGGFQKRFGEGGEFGAAPTMAERERMAGLNLAGNDPLSGRRPGAGIAGNKTDGNESSTLKEMASSLKVIESTMTE